MAIYPDISVTRRNIPIYPHISAKSDIYMIKGRDQGICCIPAGHGP